MMELFQFAAVTVILASLVIIVLLIVAVVRLGNIGFTLREQERFWRRGDGRREAYSGPDVILDDEPARAKRKPPPSPIKGVE